MIFKAKREDGRPLWRVIYDEIRSRLHGGSLNLDDIITDDELLPLIGSDDLPHYYAAAIRASKEMEQTDHRTLIRERGVGYRLAGGMGQAEKSDNYKRRSQRAMKRSLDLVTTVDHGLLSADERTTVDKQTRAIGFLVSIARMHHEKLAEQELQMKELKQQQHKSTSRQTATEEEVAEIKRRLAGVEDKVK